MTFTEAALEVLRSAGEPLHYKKITELAIERNLLSHVGKTPEVTMSSRLAMMVKKDRGQAPIIKVKPGVFAIRESAVAGLSPAALAAINEVEGLEPVEAAEGTPVTEEVKPAAPALPGADVFPEEEGDDDPILAGLEQDSEGTDRTGRRRRRRRRRGKGGDKPEGAADVSVRPEPPRERGDAPREHAAREVAREGGRERESARDRHRDRDRERDRERDRDRDRDRDRGNNRAPEDGTLLDWSRQPSDGDLLGKDLADAVWLVLSRGERNPHSFARVAELLVRRGRLSGNPAALAPTIAAAARADISRAELLRARPRFRLRNGRLGLSEWLMPKSLGRAEQDLSGAAERYASELRRALIQKLSELPTAGFAELIATWLNAEGVTALRAVRRPGSSGSELHFAGTRKHGSEEVRLAIVVQRGGRDIDRESLIDVRGALHHYGQATSAWIVTTGRVTSGAREEAAMPAAAACALFDGMALASAMERLGIGVRRHVIAHHEIDYELLEGLGDSPEQRERREREQTRERRDYAQRGEQPAARPSQEPPAPQFAREAASGEESEVADDEVRPLVPAKALRNPDWDEDDEPVLPEEADEALDEELIGPEEGEAEDLDDADDEGAPEAPELDADDLVPLRERDSREDVDLGDVEEDDEEEDDEAGEDLEDESDDEAEDDEGAAASDEDSDEDEEEDDLDSVKRER